MLIINLYIYITHLYYNSRVLRVSLLTTFGILVIHFFDFLSKKLILFSFIN